MSDTNETKRRRGTGSRVILAISLVLNIFMGALIVGAMVHHHHEDHGPKSFLARALAHADANLPPKDAEEFRNALRASAPDYAQETTDLGNARRDLEEKVAAEPFDPAVVNQALAAWRRSWDRFLDKFEPTLVDALSKISPEGRRRLSEDRRRGFGGPFN